MEEEPQPMNTTAPDGDFQLAGELVGHDRDVRGVIGLSTGLVVTASRDNSVRVWKRSDEQEWVCESTLLGHNHFVGCVHELPDGRIASGGYDKMVIVWDTTTASPDLTLIGHEDAVVSLGHTVDGDLISGSWDQTARVWRNGEAILILRGHSAAVWGVLGMPNGDIWTGSADKTIKVWRSGNCVKTIASHGDCVRGLSLVPGVGVLTASNDGMVRLLDFDGNVVSSGFGHTSFVYSTAPIPNSNDFVSGGEDCTIRIWANGSTEPQQNIDLPAGVWCVGALPNGDIISGSADGVARVWSRDPSRALAPVLQAEYFEKVKAAQDAAAAAQQGKVGALDVANLPGVEALDVAGTSEGQQKIVRNDKGGAEVYAWNAGRWEKLGDVVNAVEKLPPSLQDKDFVFDVDLNGRMYKLGMNRGENVYDAAARFIEEHNLSVEFTEQIVDFLIQNTGATRSGGGGGGGGGGAAAPVSIDPWTGGGYDPDASSGDGSFHSRFGPAAPSTTTTDTSSGFDATLAGGVLGDPYNTPSASSQRAPQQAPKPAVASPYKYFPLRAGRYYEKANWAGIVKKLNEFNDAVATSATPKLAMDVKERTVVQALVDQLGNTRFWHGHSIQRAATDLVMRCVRWPVEQRFPALDTVRIMLLHPGASASLCQGKWRNQDVIQVLLGSGLTDGSPPAAQMLILRCLANAFRNDDPRALLFQHAEDVLDAVADAARAAKATVRASLIGLLINFAASLHITPNEDLKTQCLSLLQELLEHETEGPAIADALAILGTLVWDDSVSKGLMDDLEITTKVQSFAASGEPYAKVAQDLLHYLGKRAQ